jgi:hypothetical protein
MALVRAVALKDATVVVQSSGANGVSYNLSSIITSGGTQKLFAGLHLIAACSTAVGPDTFQLFIQSASSSGFTVNSTDFIFNSMTSRGAQYGSSPGVAVITSTDKVWFRTRWTLSTGSNAPGVKFVSWVGLR